MPKHYYKDEKLLMEWRFSLKNNNHESLPDKFDYHQYNQEHLFEIPTQFLPIHHLRYWHLSNQDYTALHIYSQNTFPILPSHRYI